MIHSQDLNRVGVVGNDYEQRGSDEFRAVGRMNSMSDLHAAVVESAVQRIRSKIMTICAILFSLLPIVLSATTRSGADVVKHITAPMIGGVITSGILGLLPYPVVYLLRWKSHLRHVSECSGKSSA